MNEHIKTFDTSYGTLACRDELDGKAIAHLRTHGAYMESDLALMRAFIGVEDEIADVGANIGAFAIPLSRFAKQVHAFEPISETANQLEYNIALNGIKNITVHREGLSDVAGVLYPNRNKDSGSTSLDAVGGGLEKRRFR